MKQTLFDEKKYTALSGDSEPDFTSVEDIKQYPEYQTVKKIYNSLTTNKDRRKFAFAKDCYFITNDFVIFKIKSAVSTNLVNKSSVVRSDFISQCNNLFKVAKENKDTSSKTIIQSKETVKTVKKYNKIISELGETLYCCLNSRKSNGMITFNPDLIEAAFANLNNSYDVCLSKLNKGLNVLYINSLSVEIILCSIVSENLDTCFILNLTTYSFVKNDCTENYIAYLENEIPENNEKVEIHRKIGDNSWALKAFYDYNNKSKIYDELYTALTGKKSKAVFYDTTPDKTKLDLFRFASTDDLRPVLQTVGYKNGYAAATDSYILVWVKDQWIKEREGNCYDRLGNKSQGTYPDFLSLVPNLSKRRYIEIQINTKKLKNAVDLAKKLPKGKHTIKRTIKIDNDAYFAAKYLELILYFLDFCTNPKIYLVYDLVDDNISQMYITDKDGVHNCILMCVKDEGLKYYVDYKTLKYCVDFYSITYNKDYDKILSIVKGNCVSLDLLRAELALLEDEKLSGVDVEHELLFQHSRREYLSKCTNINELIKIIEFLKSQIELYSPDTHGRNTADRAQILRMYKERLKNANRRKKELNKLTELQRLELKFLPKTPSKRESKSLNLNSKDKKMLLSSGYLQEDLPWIEKEVNSAVFELTKKNYSRKIISAKRALELLGREKFWFGMARATFHSSSVQEITDEVYPLISFDCSKSFSGIDASISRGLMGLSDFQKNSTNILGIIKKKLPLQRSKIYPKFAVGSFVRFREFDGTIYKILSADTDGYTIVDLSMPLHCTNSLPYEYENDLIECNLQILELLCE